MVQKSGEPPGMYKNPVNNGIFQSTRINRLAGGSSVNSISDDFGPVSRWSSSNRSSRIEQELNLKEIGHKKILRPTHFGDNASSTSRMETFDVTQLEKIQTNDSRPIWGFKVEIRKTSE